MPLIKRLKKSDTIAFKEAFNQYQPTLYNYILKKTQSAYLAEEVVQITFFKLWKYRHSLKEEIPLLNQLFRIAKTTLINKLKKEQSANAYKKNTANLAEEAYEPVTEYISYAEAQSILQKLVEKLPPVRKKVFQLSRFHYMSHKQISAELSLSAKTIENHIHLALKFIKPFFMFVIVFIFRFINR